MWPRPPLDSFRKGYACSDAVEYRGLCGTKLLKFSCSHSEFYPISDLRDPNDHPRVAACRISLFLIYFYLIPSRFPSDIFTLNGAERSFAFLHLSIDPASLLTRLNKRSYAQQFTWQWLPCMGEANSCNRT